MAIVSLAGCDSMNTVVTTTTFSVALSQPVVAGDAIIVAVYTENTSLATITDTLGSSLAPVVGPLAFTSTLARGDLDIYAAFAVAGGSETVTVTTTDLSTSITVYVHEYSNLVGFDAGNAMVGSTAAMTSGPITIHAPDEVLFGFAFSDDTVMFGTGFNARSTLDLNATEDRLAMSGSDQATAMMTAGMEWAMLGAAFRTR